MGALIAHPEVHHTVPQYLLRLRDKADAATLAGEGIELWLSFEHEAIRYGVDPDISRTDLTALIDASTVVMARSEHRAHHEKDFVRWGRRGGLVTLQRYGRTWFTALARYWWGRISSRSYTAQGRRYQDTSERTAGGHTPSKRAGTIDQPGKGATALRALRGLSISTGEVAVIRKDI